MPFEYEINLQALFEESDFSSNVVIAAVSGGSDSLALLLLLNDYLKQYHPNIRLVAVTVDHKLRKESYDEALRVSEICAQYQIEHEIVIWKDEKPKSRLSEEARFARYNLLCNVAERLNCKVIMTGHTLDDQAETYEMRLKRGSQRGLASMPRISLLYDKIKLVRPLLSCRRQSLRHYLTSHHMTWIDDPSNKNVAYERVQIRNHMSEEKINIASHHVQIAREKRQTQAENVANLIAAINPVLKNDYLMFKPLPQNIINNEQFGFTLGVLVAIMGGASFLPTHQQLDKIRSFAKSPNDNFNRMTLMGAVIEKGKHQWKIWRENRGVISKTLNAFEKTIWDGRFLIENQSSDKLLIEPATMKFLKQLEKNKAKQNEKSHYASLLVSPIIRQNAKIDAPIIMGEMQNIQNVFISRIMKPFYWVISGDDFVMVDKLKPIFYQKYGDNEKN